MQCYRCMAELEGKPHFDFQLLLDTTGYARTSHSPPLMKYNINNYVCQKCAKAINEFMESD